MSPCIQFALLCAVIIVLIYFYCGRREDFANVTAKATQLSQWMNAHPNGSYDEFIRNNPESNIVEYTKLRDITASSGHTTIGSAVEALKI